MIEIISIIIAKESAESHIKGSCLFLHTLNALHKILTEIMLELLAEFAKMIGKPREATCRPIPFLLRSQIVVSKVLGGLFVKGWVLFTVITIRNSLSICRRFEKDTKPTALLNVAFRIRPKLLNILKPL